MTVGLFLVTGSLDRFRRKGVDREILERDEGGWFSRVVTVHVDAGGEGDVEIAPGHRVVDLPGSPLAAVAPTIALARSERATLIRATDPYVAVTAWVTALVTRTPWCLSAHADFDLLRSAGAGPVIRGSQILTDMVERFAFSRAPLVMAISRSVAEYARRHGARRDRIRLTPHGVDLEAPNDDPARLRDVHGLVGAELVVFVGRLDRGKSVELIPEVARLVMSARETARFIVVGDGELRPSLDARLRDLGLADRVLVLGLRPREEAMAWRAAASANLCGVGMFSLLEAAASGRPVVALDVEAAGEVIQDGRNGLLVAADDPASAAAAILRLLADPELSARLGAAAREQVRITYSRQAASRRRIACYEEMLGRAHTP